MAERTIGPSCVEEDRRIGEGFMCRAAGVEYVFQIERYILMFITGESGKWKSDNTIAAGYTWTTDNGDI